MTWLTVIEYLCHKWPRICSLVINTSRTFPQSWLINGFVTRFIRRVSLVEQELLTFSDHLSTHPIFLWGSCYPIFSFMCVLCRSLFVAFVHFLLAMLLSALLRFTDSDYLFGIFKLFLQKYHINMNVHLYIKTVESKAICRAGKMGCGAIFFFKFHF